MRRVWTSCLCVLWIALVTIITIVVHLYLDPLPTPQSSVVAFAAGCLNVSAQIDVNIMALAWGLERVLPIHLGIYLVWRVFEAIFLR